MKTRNILTLLGACCLFGTAALLPAQASAQPVQRDGFSAQDRGGEVRERGQRKRGGMMMMRILRQLDLTDAQKEQIRPILQQTRERIKAIKQNDALSQEAKKEQISRVREANQTALRGVLTAEQVAQLESIMERIKERRENRGGGDRRGPRGPRA